VRWKFLLQRAVQILVLEEHDRVIVANGGFEHSLGVVRRGRRNHDEPRAMRKPGGEALRVIKAAADAASVANSKRDGASLRAGAAVAQARGLLRNRVHSG